MTLIHFGTTYIVVKNSYTAIKALLELNVNFQVRNESNDLIMIIADKICYISEHKS